MLRTLTYYKDFFVDVVAECRKFLPDVPIVAGGPHPTIDPEDCLRPGGVDVCVLGEGEIVCGVLVGAMLEAGRFPDAEILKGIKGIAFRSDRQILPAEVMTNGKNATYARYPLWVRAGTEKAGSK